MANEKLIFLACNIYSILAEYSLDSSTFRWALWLMGLWFVITEYDISAAKHFQFWITTVLFYPTRCRWWSIKVSWLSSLMTTKWHVCQWRLRSAWTSAQSDQSLLWRKLGSWATHWGHSEDSDQTGWMPRLIWVSLGTQSSCWFCHEAAHLCFCLSVSLLYIFSVSKPGGMPFSPHVVPQLTPTLALPMVVCKVAVDLALQLLTQQ